MESLLEKLTDWLKDMLVGGIMDNLTSTFSTLNQKIGEVTAQVAQTPEQFQPTVYNLIRNLSENVILPIAGIILTFIACYELIQLVIAHNNLANFETWIFFKWVFKTFVAVTLITNTFNITMAVFDVAQHVVNQSGSLIAGSTAVDGSTLATMQTTLEAMDVGPLFGIFLQSFAVKFLFEILSILIWAIVYGRMIEIYLTISLAPIPFEPPIRASRVTFIGEARISNNLNQYAKKANETGNIYREDIAELKEMHDEQTKLLKKTLKSVIHLYDVDSKKSN